MALRTIRTSAWLGWQVEANWAQPLFFLGFSVLRPVSSILILVFMYYAVARTGTQDPIFPYIYLGSAFYIYATAVMSGGSYVILDDREHYRVLKYFFIAPIHPAMYMLGRALARFVISTLAVVIVLAMGILLFDLPVRVDAHGLMLFVAAFPLGIVAMTFMGIALGAWTLTLRTEPWFAGDSIAGALYLFSGALFPVTLLPPLLQPLSYFIPMTYWLELIRRALLGGQAVAVAPTLARFSDGQLLAILALLTGVIVVGGMAVYRHFDFIARERGLVDSVSNF